ncbi:MAG TPA: hypothetical protein VG297_18300 [Bryobacteraceae bacterium]|nr:hypothetical protein [Bryobacteraceae bacterium]
MAASAIPEDRDETRRRRFGMRHALAGLQAGVLGALVILACLMIGSLWDGRSIWFVPNLFATTFFGGAAYRNQFVRATWSGLAMLIATYGGLGALWGWVWGDRRGSKAKPGSRSLLRLYGAIAGLLVYLIAYDWLWKHVNPLVTLYAPSRQLQVGHILWGIVLARSPLYARRIEETTTPPLLPPIPPTSTPVQEEAVQEVRSGEVIL